MENEILENIIYNILGGYEPTRLIPKDTKFLLIVVDEVDFIIRILTTWPTPRDWYLTWFQEPHQKALIDSNKEFSKNEIYNRTNEIWDDMAQALTSTGTMHPRHYILPPVRIKFGKTRQDYERDRLLGWHHLGLLYPITKAKKFMKEERLRLRHEKQKARREDERYKLKYCNGIVCVYAP